MEKDLIRIETKGGVLSPSELIKIIEVAEALGHQSIHFGSRQDIVFPTADQDTRTILEQFPDVKFDYLSNETVYHNICSSYVSADISPSTSWLNGVTYLYILEQFDYSPKLEINLTDPQQRLVPLFAGELNFIASEEEDYWYLYLRLKNFKGIQRYPVLLYTWDIAKVAKTIEAVYEESMDLNELFEEVSNELDTNSRNISKPLNLNFRAFPYYEGMNKMNIDQYWLGLYWRNNCYDTHFLKALGNLCLSCKIGKICLTPWKSFIVKGIHKKDRLRWEKLLGKFGINVRHSSLELNWHLPLRDVEALALKRFIVRNFDQNDISTYGLTFSIKSAYGVNFTSIVIEQNPIPSIVKNFPIRPTYNVLYCENFDPNRLKYITYAQDVDKIELPGLLMELSQMYFEQLGEDDQQINPASQSPRLSPEKPKQITYQCTNCFTVYDSKYGDSISQIPPGVPFAELPATYCCPVCNSEKKLFQKVVGQSSLYLD
ncbi:MAG: rubredoxin [Bacteroidota bacterium]